MSRKTGRPPSMITRGEAAKMISAFLNHPGLGPYGIDKNLGGIFDRFVFELDETKAGSLLWFCYNDKETPEKQLYLAASKVSGYTPNVTRQATDILWKPYDYFKYTGSSTSEAAVLEFIETHEYGTPGQSPMVPEAIVRARVNDFMTNLLPTFSPHPADLLEYSFSFFGEMSCDFQIRQLLAQDGAIGVRYYLGYEAFDEGVEVNNKIRIILVAIDKFGRNILGAENDEEMMLQKSFPPPPSGGG
jgi:hypothetical protein